MVDKVSIEAELVELLRWCRERIADCPPYERTSADHAMLRDIESAIVKFEMRELH